MCYQSIDCVEIFLVLGPVQFLSTWNSQATAENASFTGYQRMLETTGQMDGKCV